MPAALRVLSSVKVLGEGVDTANCDSAAFCDAQGSMIDIVQMVGRALRIKPGQGKIASLIVPVFLAPAETSDEMLTSQAYGTLAKVLSALRAHDTETIEHLADPRIRSGSWHPEGAEEGEAEAEREVSEGERGPGVPAQELLKFSTPRDPALLARFVKLRVTEPENTFWRRGIQACVRYVKETGAVQLRDTVVFIVFTAVARSPWRRSGLPLRFGGCASAVAA
ncbi:helicase-related protein [Streptomyces celluloflavus]|uniref:helicase-related protein n=1 Tax=Streptomyces celluloflavus TaxID=58344 RepID=UPI00368B5FD5